MLQYYSRAARRRRFWLVHFEPLRQSWALASDWSVSIRSVQLEPVEKQLENVVMWNQKGGGGRVGNCLVPSGKPTRLLDNIGIVPRRLSKLSKTNFNCTIYITIWVRHRFLIGSVRPSRPQKLNIDQVRLGWVKVRVRYRKLEGGPTGCPYRLALAIPPEGRRSRIGLG
jgi:hypothetical protein